MIALQVKRDGPQPCKLHACGSHRRNGGLVSLGRCQHAELPVCVDVNGAACDLGVRDAGDIYGRVGRGRADADEAVVGGSADGADVNVVAAGRYVVTGLIADRNVIAAGRVFIECGIA